MKSLTRAIQKSHSRRAASGVPTISNPRPLSPSSEARNAQQNKEFGRADFEEESGERSAADWLEWASVFA